MRWRVLGPALGAILLAAIVFSLWPHTPPPVSAEPEPVAPPAPPPPVAPVAPVAPAPTRPAPPPPSPAGSPPPASEELAAPPPTSGDGGWVQDPVPDEAYAASLGIEVEPEPEDAGALHPLTRDGIKGAITQELPELRECYEAWLEQDPRLAGQLKVQFTIVEVPGRARGKVAQVHTADGGMGHLAFEGCVRNVFKGLRFERPERGELKVTYPLTFSQKP